MHFRKGSCCDSQWVQSEGVEGRRGGDRARRHQNVLLLRLGREEVRDELELEIHSIEKIGVVTL